MTQPTGHGLKQLWLRKSVAQIQSEYEQGELKRTLGPVNLVLLGIGCIIGAGIFVRTGNAAALHAGPAVMLSFVIAGLVCAFAGLCYAELASTLPVSGSAYTYSYTTLGEFAAWIMGSLLLLEYGLAASVVAVGWSEYAVSFLKDLHIDIPPEFSQAFGKQVVLTHVDLSLTNPTVSLGGLTTTLADGTPVQFLSKADASLPGQFAAALERYAVVAPVDGGGFKLTNGIDVAIAQDVTATLTKPTDVLNPATKELREIAAGAQVLVPAGAGVVLPKDSAVPLADSFVIGSLFNLPAVVVVLSMTALLVFGVSESASVNNIIVAIKVIVILAFIGVGAFFVNPDNWRPFIPEPTGEPGEFGWSGVLRAATIVFFAYIGFEAVSTAGQEAKNPQRDMPVGIIGSLVVCTILYMATAAVLTGVMPFTKLNVGAPVAAAVNSFGPQWAWLAAAIKIGAIAGLTSVILVLMYGQTRIFYTMSRDGLLPGALARVHSRFKTPWLNTLVVGCLVALAAAVFDINTLGDLTSIGTLAAFAIVCLSVVWLRQTRPDLPRQFKVPLYPALPLVGIASCLFLVFQVEPKVQIFFLWFLVGSIALYFAYGMWNSKLAKGERVVGHEPPAGELPHPGA